MKAGVGREESRLDHFKSIRMHQQDKVLRFSSVSSLEWEKYATCRICSNIIFYNNIKLNTAICIVISNTYPMLTVK